MDGPGVYLSPASKRSNTVLGSNHITYTYIFPPPEGNLELSCIERVLYLIKLLMHSSLLLVYPHLICKHGIIKCHYLIKTLLAIWTSTNNKAKQETTRVVEPWPAHHGLWKHTCKNSIFNSIPVYCRPKCMHIMLSDHCSPGSWKIKSTDYGIYPVFDYFLPRKQVMKS